jgi:hypothetical protein
VGATSSEAKVGWVVSCVSDDVESGVAVCALLAGEPQPAIAAQNTTIESGKWILFSPSISTPFCHTMLKADPRFRSQHLAELNSIKN